MPLKLLCPCPYNPVPPLLLKSLSNQSFGVVLTTQIDSNTIQYNSHLVYAKIQDRHRPVAYYKVNRSYTVMSNAR